MAIATYTDLKSALADWMVGQSVSGQLDTFIALAEAELCRKLRTAQMVSRSTTTVDTQYLALPVDYLEARNLTANLAGGDVTLRQITLDQADYQRVHMAGSSPAYFVVSGSEIEIVPQPSTEITVELVYYSKIPALSETTATNFVLATWPDLYLNCALAHAQPYLANPQFAAFHRAETDRILEEIRFADVNAQLGSTPLIARPRRSF